MLERDKDIASGGADGATAGEADNDWRAGLSDVGRTLLANAPEPPPPKPQQQQPPPSQPQLRGGSGSGGGAGGRDGNSSRGASGGAAACAAEPPGLERALASMSLGQEPPPPRRRPPAGDAEIDAFAAKLAAAKARASAPAPARAGMGSRHRQEPGTSDGGGGDGISTLLAKRERQRQRDAAKQHRPPALRVAGGTAGPEGGGSEVAAAELDAFAAKLAAAAAGHSAAEELLPSKSASWAKQRLQQRSGQTSPALAPAKVDQPSSVAGSGGAGPLAAAHAVEVAAVRKQVEEQFGAHTTAAAAPPPLP